MNKRIEKIEATMQTRKKLQARDLLVICLLGIFVLVGIWVVFREEKNGAESAVAVTQTEQSVSDLLSQIQGVGEADVMIFETEEGVQSVVVVCEGARDLQVIINVREAVAAALGTQEKAVKVYLKKD